MERVSKANNRGKNKNTPTMSWHYHFLTTYWRNGKVVVYYYCHRFWGVKPEDGKKSFCLKDKKLKAFEWKSILKFLAKCEKEKAKVCRDRWLFVCSLALFKHCKPLSGFIVSLWFSCLSLWICLAVLGLAGQSRFYPLEGSTFLVMPEI